MEDTEMMALADRLYGKMVSALYFRCVEQTHAHDLTVDEMEPRVVEALEQMDAVAQASAWEYAIDQMYQDSEQVDAAEETLEEALTQVKARARKVLGYGDF